MFTVDVKQQCNNNWLSAEFHSTDFVICSHSREGKTLSYSQINLVQFLWTHALVSNFIACLEQCFHEQKRSGVSVTQWVQQWPA